MLDLDRRLIEAASSQGLVAPERLAASGSASTRRGRAYRAQELVREGALSCEDLLRLLHKVGARVYVCPGCGQRLTKRDLPKARAEALACPGCGLAVRRARGGLTLLEVLTSRDPLDLCLPLERVEPPPPGGDEELPGFDPERFEVRGELGRGGYGVVLAAWQRDLEREVALKVLRSQDGLPAVALERFLREGRALSKLRHPNLVSIFDIGRFRELTVMVMEQVRGRSLKDHLAARGGRLPWREALALIDGVLAGLEEAHRAGIVHRDLKPSNVLVEEELDRVRLIDFGLAKVLEGQGELTVAGAIVGSPAYLSPEQVAGRSAQADARTDLFACGLLLYEALAGRRAFPASEKQAIYAQILRDDPAPLRELVPEAPAELEALVARLLAKDPAKRPASAGEVRQAIAALLALPVEEAAPAAAASAATPPRRTRSAARPRTAPAPAPASRGLAVGGIAVGLLVLGVAVGVLGRRAVADAPDPALAVAPTPEGPAAPEPTPTPSRAPEPEPEPEPEQDPQPPAPAPKPSLTPLPEPSQAPEPEPTAEPEPEPTVEPEPEPPAPEPSAAPGATPAAQVGVVVDCQVLNLRAGPGADQPVLTQAQAGESLALGSGRAGGWIEVRLPDGRAAWASSRYLRLEALAPPEPGPGRLDDGQGDAAEFPDLADRSRKSWLDRAFAINRLAAEVGDPRSVRGLRLALKDRHPLNLAFALRGLLAQPVELLRAVGSQALFEGLVGVLDEREPYVQRSAQALLVGLAGGGEPRSAREWRKWWDEEGAAALLAAAQGPLPARRAAGQEAVDLAGQVTQTRQYFSELRDRGLELVFLMDVTLSMTDELARVRAQVREITSFVDLLLDGKVRLGFVTYGDDVVALQPLTRNLDGFATAVEGIAIWNDPNDRTVEEGVEKALEAATGAENKLGWRPRSQKVLVLLGDAPPLDPAKARELAKQAGEAGFVIGALTAKPPDKYAHKNPKDLFAELARLGGDGLCGELDDPEELITRLLVMSFGSRAEYDLRLFVRAYREVTGAANRR